MSEKKLEFSVAAKESGERIFVDKFDGDVWLAVHIRRSASSTILTKTQARELIAALMLVMEAE